MKKLPMVILFSLCLFFTTHTTVSANSELIQPSVEHNQSVSDIYTVTLKVNTDGVESTTGGSVIAKGNNLSGGEGTTIELIPTPSAGYQFVGYTSFRADNGMSTDGLMPIENNQFDLSEKLGNVIVYANFEKIKADANTYFSDDFSSWSVNRYQLLGDTSAVTLDNERLLFSSTSVATTLMPNIESNIVNSENIGYQVSFDLQQVEPVKSWNTIRVGIYQNADLTYDVLEFNGKKAYIKKISDLDAGIQDGTIISETVQCELGSEVHHLSIIVKGNQISITNNDAPLLSYTAETYVGSGQPFVAFQTVSTGRNIAIDNLTVQKLQERKNLHIINRLNGIEDTESVSGIVIVSQQEVGVGDLLNISSVTKPGYFFNGWKDINNNSIDLETYTVPATDSDEVIIYADFVTNETKVTVRDYYVDSNTGDDNNEGTEELPLKSLKVLHDKVLNPGDRILLKAGSSYNGLDAELKFQGSGTTEKPIYVGSYGEGARPVLNGEGKVENLVSLYNQECITIENLELTNLDSQFSTSFELNSNNNKSKALRAVNVSAKDFGIIHNITLRGLHIHDVNGKLNMKWNGGIFFDVKATVQGSEIKGVPTKYDGILIENNIIERVDRSALKLVSSSWCNQSVKNDPNLPLNWYPSTNVIVRNNRIDKVGGDAITTRDTDGALIEYNKVSDSRYQETGYNAGIWPFQATNTVIQYNEVYRTRGVQDGQGFDTDHISSDTVMQYNYSHDNEGGFMLVMNGFPHVSPTIRYNISINDKDKTIEFSRGTPAGVVFYNNTLYSDSKLRGRAGIIDMPNTKAGTGNREAFFFNNIFYYPEGESFFVEQSDAKNNMDKFLFYNNAYSGVTPPTQETQAITGITVPENVSAIPKETNTPYPRTGQYLINELDVFKLSSTDTKLVHSGVTLQEAIAHFYSQLNITNQNPISEQERLTSSPTVIFDLAEQRSSVDAISQTYPTIVNVNYATDFFGTELPTTNLSLGAAQYTRIEIAADTDENTESRIN